MADSARSLRVFFDAGAGTALWAANDAARDAYGYAIDCGVLPVSASIAAEFAALVAAHDARFDWDDPGGPSRWTAASEAAFASRASAAIAALRRELGPAFVVIDARDITR